MAIAEKISSGKKNFKRHRSASNRKDTRAATSALLDLLHATNLSLQALILLQQFADFVVMFPSCLGLLQFELLQLLFEIFCRGKERQENDEEAQQQKKRVSTSKWHSPPQQDNQRKSHKPSPFSRMTALTSTLTVANFCACCSTTAISCILLAFHCWRSSRCRFSSSSASFAFSLACRNCAKSRRRASTCACCC